MKMLKIRIEHGDYVIPMEGKPFVDADVKEEIEMHGAFSQLDGDKLGTLIFEALGRMAEKSFGDN